MLRLPSSDQGPMAHDFFWVLIGESGGCAVSSLAEGSNELLIRLQSLPGFNNEAILRAAGSTENAKFICWKQDDGLEPDRAEVSEGQPE